MGSARVRWIAMAVIAAVAVVIPYGMASGADTPSELRVQLKWYHQAQFAGFYAAIDQGYFAVSPAEYGVVNIEDGLYVESKRLADPGFREQLAALLVGLEEGWSFAASNPSATVQLVLDNDSQLDAFSQRRELEVVLPLLGTRFGYFDVAKYETFDTWGRPLLPADLHQRLWTHDVFNRAQAITGRMGFISPVTRHYIEVVRDTDWYRVLVWFGVFAASFSGALLGVRMRYRLWGRILLGMMTALGGGVVRDVLLGGARYPIPLLHDVKTLLVSLLGVGVVSGLLHLPRGERLLLRAHRLNDYADVVGFAILAINGATIALISNASVIWAPICAAITVSGGGLLSDIICGREHRRFRGEVYDEVAVVGALVLLGFLKFADGHEHRPGQVLGSVAFALFLLLAARYAVLRFRLQYPTWTRRTGSVDGDAVVAVP